MIYTASPTLHKLTHGWNPVLGSMSKLNVFGRFDSSIVIGVVWLDIVVLFCRYLGENEKLYPLDLLDLFFIFYSKTVYLHA